MNIFIRSLSWYIISIYAYFEGEIDSLTLASNYSTVGDNESKRQFVFEEGVNTYVACRSRGGNPIPKLSIFRCLDRMPYRNFIIMSNQVYKLL